jgi:hypothetical protein
MGPVLFIENREKTVFWAAIARALMARGIPCAWLVQNPVFAPRNAGPVYRLNFPSAADRNEGGNEEDRFACLASDRGRLHFDAGDAHYSFYARQIDSAIREIAPALVIGETTLFHELLAVDAARAQQIPYVMPDGERYQPDRFTLLRGGTLHRYGRSNEKLNAAERRAMAERIAHPAATPHYVRSRGPVGNLLKKVKWAATRERVWRGRLIGERYNTPSLMRKLTLGRRTAANLQAWDGLASVPMCAERTILYPMQLQPEANLDVWGQPYTDQTAMIEHILDATPTDVKVAVKVNPNAKYEVSDRLISFARANVRVALLPRTFAMGVAQKHSTGSITVTGTVGLEAVFGRGRCLSLRHPDIAMLFPDLTDENPQSAANRLLEDASVGRGSLAMGEELLDHFQETSFQGVVSDPLTQPNCLAPENIRQVSDGIIRGWETMEGQTGVPSRAGHMAWSGA